MACVVALAVNFRNVGVRDRGGAAVQRYSTLNFLTWMAANVGSIQLQILRYKI